MIRQLEQSHDNVIGYAIADDVDEGEYAQMLSELRDEIHRHGNIRVLFRLKDLSLGSFFTSLGERMDFLRDHRDDVERVAVVTDDMSVEIAAKGSEVLRPIETETFSSDDEQQAWAWLS
jgi:hypothetical protein